ncbi:SMI1/KNR4 family protein [Ruminococcus albus]|uniref:SMI1 / KNR4 family (SUKH-1) n=1 Tax=Ruminococcus albus TaxID=1264 RepID=A0A1I1EC81_RUMAL|nr:SMI1/KNR4 family protein [Ruminococcus albus]SFB84734.1 SMI1 / KNR4 family (SUKH-1) [Ruminococcus albus]
MLISKFNVSDVESSISKFEAEYTVSFPDTYREFLLKYNGGYTPKTKVSINRASSDLRALFGYAEAYQNYNILSVFSSSDIINYTKSGLIPIGANVFGDYFLIRINGDDYGAVYFRYHDKNIADIFIADSFKTFVSKCKSEMVGHIRTIEERKADLIANGLDIWSSLSRKACGELERQSLSVKAQK